MPEEEEQHEPKQDVHARAETAPEPPETAPRGNVLSEPDADEPGECPAPLPH